jgi:hypothetical protein
MNVVGDEYILVVGRRWKPGGHVSRPPLMQFFLTVRGRSWHPKNSKDENGNGGAARGGNLLKGSAAKVP